MTPKVRNDSAATFAHSALGVSLCGIFAVLIVSMSGSRSNAQSLVPPPTALPVHSALVEDQRTNAGTAVIVPPSTLRSAETIGETLEPEFVAGPSFLPSDFGQKAWPMPTPGPLFSWKPTYIPPESRSGMFQQGLVRATYLPRLDNASGFGMTDVTKQITLAVPPFFKGSPIMFSPGYTAHFLDGPASRDAPPSLHDIELEFRWMNQLTERWGVDLAITPSYYGDFDNDSSDAYRIAGRVLTAWNWTPELKLVGGILFLGREDYPYVPVGGVLWEPNDDWRFELVIPRPRVYYRFFCNGDVEHRAFIGGEFGGNTWAIDRAGGVADKFTYGDLRLVAGWERKRAKGVTARFEAGWVFSREISYLSGYPDFKPDDTFMVRGEASF